MRPPLLTLAILATLSAPLFAQTTELVNGRAQFTGDYQRQLAADGFRRNADGSYSKVVSRNGIPFEESSRRFDSASFMGGSSSNFPRNPNPIPAINVGDPRGSTASPAPAYADQSPDVARADNYMASRPPHSRPPTEYTKGDKGDPGPAGPRGPQGPAGESATLTSEHLASIATIIIERMKADPDAWRGANGKDGRDGADATLPSQLFVLEFENGDGSVARSEPVELGGVARIPPMRLQIQNEDEAGNVSHFDRAEPLGKPIAIKLPAPQRK